MDSNHSDADDLRDHMDGFCCRKCGFYNLVERDSPVTPSPSTFNNINNNNNNKKTTSQSTRKQNQPNLPTGLDDFLLNFTVSIIEKQPNDLDQFAYEYFTNIHSQRNGECKFKNSFKILQTN